MAAAGRAFTAKDLVTLDRVSDPRLSPDGKFVVYDLRTTDLAKNRGHHAAYLLDLATSKSTLIARGATNARFSPDGSAIYAIMDDKGTSQVFRMGLHGEHRARVTGVPMDVQTFRIARDGKHIVVALAVFADCPTLACTKERLAKRAETKATGTVYDRLFIRHWDQWADGTRNHLFAFALDKSGVATGAAVNLMRALDGDTPSKPFGGDDDFAISPNGKTVVFSMRFAGKSEPWSTNFDLYSVPMDGARAPENLTAENKAWDGTPVFSPDGTKLAYLAMKRPTFESDRYGVMIRDLRTGATKEIDPSWDRSAQSIAWSQDGRTLFVTADDLGSHRLFSMNVATGAVKALTGNGDVDGINVAGDTIVYGRSSIDAPADLYRIRATGGTPVRLTHVNAEKLAGVTLSPNERFSFTGWNGDTVYGNLIKPYGYVAGKKYPVAFLIHGGPQGSWIDGWSYRWNPQTYAGHGYVVVQIDPHGSTGYGQAFTDAISQHWGDRPLDDLKAGWTAAQAKFPFIDANRACALGASYGGFMAYWIAGNWNQPWKCIVAHDGVFDNRIMGYATEELWFSEWENGGTPWEHPENYERFNPADHVADWRVPMLIVHSALDFRIPIEQGIGAFTALQRKGVPSELLTFPDENHWVLKPQNSLQWHDTVQQWLDRWTK